MIPKLTLKKHGVMLVFTILIIALLIILLTASISQLQNSIFLTNKVEAETRSYWASFAGLEYAHERINGDVGWPNNPAAPLSSAIIGDFSIREEAVSGGVRVYGLCESQNSEFYLAFNTAYASENSIMSNITDVKGKLLNCYSCNGLSTAFANGTDFKDGYELNTKFTSPRVLITARDAMDREHRVALPANAGVYVSCEGRNRNQSSRIERIYAGKSGLEDFSAALYVGGSTNASVHEKFSVTDVNGGRPSIVTEKGMTVTALGQLPDSPLLYGNPSINTSLPPDTIGNGPLAFHDGTVYTNASNIQVNGTQIVTGQSVNSKKYGITVMPVADVRLPNVKPQENTAPKELPGGYYTFVEKEKVSNKQLITDLFEMAPSTFLGILGKIPLIGSVTKIVNNMTGRLLGAMAGFLTDVFFNNTTGDKFYQLIYFPNEYGDPKTNFTQDLSKKTTSLAIARRWLKDLGGPVGWGTLLKCVFPIPRPDRLLKLVPQYVLDRYVKDMKKEIKGDFIEFKMKDGSTYYGYKPNGVPFREADLKNAPFEVATDVFTMNVRESINITGGDFTFQTIELNDKGGYTDAEYARGALYITKKAVDGVTEKPSIAKLKVSSAESISVHGFLLGNLDMRSEKDIMFEAGGQINQTSQKESSDESEIAVLANNITIEYNTVRYNPYFAPENLVESVLQLVAKGDCPFKIGDEIVLPEYDSKAFEAYVDRLKTQTVNLNPHDPANGGKNTLENILANYNYSKNNDTFYSQKRFIYDYLDNNPKILTYDPKTMPYKKPFLPTSNIRGIVYAYRDLNIVLNPSYNGDVAIEGVVICGSGNFTVSNVNNLSLRYNPNLSIISSVLDTPQESVFLSELFFNKF